MLRDISYAMLERRRSQQRDHRRAEGPAPVPRDRRCSSSTGTVRRGRPRTARSSSRMPSSWPAPVSFRCSSHALVGSRVFKKRKREEDYARSIQQVKDLRRALDVLLAQPNVDPARVAFVGHDFGAMYGVLEAANDKRIQGIRLHGGRDVIQRLVPLRPGDATRRAAEVHRRARPARSPCVISRSCRCRCCCSSRTRMSTSQTAGGHGRRRGAGAENGSFYNAGHELTRRRRRSAAWIGRVELWVRYSGNASPITELPDSAIPVALKAFAGSNRRFAFRNSRICG